MISAVCFDLDGTLGGYGGDFGGLLAVARSELGLEQCDMNRFAAILQQELRRDGPLDLATALSRTLERLEQRPPPRSSSSGSTRRASSSRCYRTGRRTCSAPRWARWGSRGASGSC